MAKASRDKGKRREREFRDIAKSWGFVNARRGQQFSGEQGNPDVVCHPELHFEVKGDNQITVFAVLAQAREDAEGAEKKLGHPVLPIGAVKRDLKPWFIVMETEVLKQLLIRGGFIKQ